MRWAAVVAAMIGAATGVRAADSDELVRAAKAERTRRARLVTPAPVWSNQPGPALGALLAPAATPAPASDVMGPPAPPPQAAATPAPAPAASEADGARPAPEPPERDEAYWRERIAAALDRIRQLEQDLEWTRLRLYREQVGSGEPRSTAVYDSHTAIARLLGERARLEAELESARAEPARIRQEARRAGAPPGWLR